MAATTDILTVCQSEGTALLRTRLLDREQTKRVEAAALDAIRKGGCSIDEVSEATGLTPADLRRLLDKPVEWEDDINVLAGVR